MDDEDVLVITTTSQSQRNSEYNQNTNFKNQSLTNPSNNFPDHQNNSINQQSTLANLDSKYNIVEDLEKVKANATLLDLACVPEHYKNLEMFLASGLVNQFVNKPVNTSA